MLRLWYVDGTGVPVVGTLSRRWTPLIYCDADMQQTMCLMLSSVHPRDLILA